VEGNESPLLKEEELVAIAKLVGTPEMNTVPTEDLIASLWHYFSAADTNGSGKLDQAECRKCLLENFSLSEEKLSSFFEDADVNKDGKVDWQEFVPQIMGKVAVIPGPPEGDPPPPVCVPSASEVGAPPPPNMPA